MQKKHSAYFLDSKWTTFTSNVIWAREILVLVCLVVIYEFFNSLIKHIYPFLMHWNWNNIAKNCHWEANHPSSLPPQFDSRRYQIMWSDWGAVLSTFFPLHSVSLDWMASTIGLVFKLSHKVIDLIEFSTFYTLSSCMFQLHVSGLDTGTRIINYDRFISFFVRPVIQT